MSKAKQWVWWNCVEERNSKRTPMEHATDAVLNFGVVASRMGGKTHAMQEALAEAGKKAGVSAQALARVFSDAAQGTGKASEDLTKSINDEFFKNPK